MNEATEALYERGLKIVDHEARRRRRDPIEHDELCSIGRLALVQVVSHYDPNRGTFPAYARPRIRGAMADEIRKKRRRKVSRRPTHAADHVGERVAHRLGPVDGRDCFGAHHSVLATDSQHHGLLLPSDRLEEVALSREPDPEEALCEAEHQRGLRQALDNLPAAERTVVVSHYYGGDSLSAIARREGITRYAARRHRRRSLDRLAKRLQRLAPVNGGKRAARG